MNEILKFFFVLFCFLLAHLLGHGIVMGNGNMFQFNTFGATQWVFFIVYYAIAVSASAAWCQEDWD